jgi:hypothetical protein
MNFKLFILLLLVLVLSACGTAAPVGPSNTDEPKKDAPRIQMGTYDYSDSSAYPYFQLNCDLEGRSYNLYPDAIIKAVSQDESGVITAKFALTRSFVYDLTIKPLESEENGDWSFKGEMLLNGEKAGEITYLSFGGKGRGASLTIDGTVQSNEEVNRCPDVSTTFSASFDWVSF